MRISSTNCECLPRSGRNQAPSDLGDSNKLNRFPWPFLLGEETGQIVLFNASFIVLPFNAGKDNPLSETIRKAIRQKSSFLRHNSSAKGSCHLPRFCAAYTPTIIFSHITPASELSRLSTRIHNEYSTQKEFQNQSFFSRHHHVRRGRRKFPF